MGQFVQDLGEARVNRGKPAQHSFVAREMFESGAGPGEIADGEKEKQDGEGGENDLQGAVDPQCANKHDGGEQSPHGEVGGHGRLIGGVDPPEFRQDDQGHERPPEETVGNESGGCERVPFLPFHDPGDDLRDPAITNTHCENHAVEFVETGIVQVKQDRGHAEAEEAERGRIAGGILDLSNRIFVHKMSANRLIEGSIMPKHFLTLTKREMACQ